MKSIIFVSALYLQLQWSYGKPEGVGAFAYQDSTGNRYGGTYGLKDGQAYNYKNTDDSTTFGPNPFPDFQDLDSFFPEYFRNLDNLLQDFGGRRFDRKPIRGSGGFGPQRPFGSLRPAFKPAFKHNLGFNSLKTRRVFAKNSEQQKKALNAAKKAFDLTSNNAGYVPNFDNDFNRFPGFPNFGFPQPDFHTPGFGAQPHFGEQPGFGAPFMQSNFQPLPMPGPNSLSENSAFAGGAVAPGYRHQMVALNPVDPNQPNVDVTKFSDSPSASSRSPQFYSVQSSSFVTSTNLNGRQMSHKGGETIVNDNGKITKYSLGN